MRYLKLLLLMIVLATGARVTAATPSSARNERTETQWKPVSFGATGAESPVVEGPTTTIKFGADGFAMPQSLHGKLEFC